MAAAALMSPSPLGRGVGVRVRPEREVPVRDDRSQPAAATCSPEAQRSATGFPHPQQPLSRRAEHVHKSAGHGRRLDPARPQGLLPASGGGRETSGPTSTCASDAALKPSPACGGGPSTGSGERLGGGQRSERSGKRHARQLSPPFTHAANHAPYCPLPASPARGGGRQATASDISLRGPEPRRALAVFSQLVGKGQPLGRGVGGVRPEREVPVRDDRSHPAAATCSPEAQRSATGFPHPHPHPSPEGRGARPHPLRRSCGPNA
jgi:hypothetical protein